MLNHLGTLSSQAREGDLTSRLKERLRSRIRGEPATTEDQPDPATQRPYRPAGLFDIGDLLESVLSHYAGASLDEALGGGEVRMSAGRCHCIVSAEEIPMPADKNLAVAHILAEPQLLPGIGPKTRERLRHEGCSDLRSIVPHKRFGAEARKLLDMVEGRRCRDLSAHLARRLPLSHPLMLAASSLHDSEDFLFVDIETLGLSGHPLILLGAGRIKGQVLHVEQFLLRDPGEEPAALAALLDRITDRTALVTFNGRGFDWPFILNRLSCHVMAAPPDPPHYDVCLFARRLWRGRTPNHKLDTLETALLGVERKIDVPSALVPELYRLYLRSGNPGPLVPIVEHNRQDVVSTARLFALMQRNLSDS